MKYKTLLLITIIMQLGACSGLPTFSNLNKDYTFSEHDSIVIIGVNPRYRIGIQSGKYDGEYWERNELSVLSLNLFPEKGYVVAKLPPLKETEAYALDQVLPDDIGGKRYPLCDKHSTLTFNTIKGKVLYIGDIKLLQKDNKLKISFDSNIEHARKFLLNEYPTLANKLVSAETKIIPTKEECKPETIYIII